jgi:hypothetical protein
MRFGEVIYELAQWLSVLHCLGVIPGLPSVFPWPDGINSGMLIQRFSNLSQAGALWWSETQT